jgi:hypothetical protein
MGRRRPELIWLSTCSCDHCKGRAAVCTAAFRWIDRRDPDHVPRHAKEDLFGYFDRLPAEVKDALNQAEVNVCSCCAELWMDQYGAGEAAGLICDFRFIDHNWAVTPVEGWPDKEEELEGLAGLILASRDRHE